MLSWPSDHVEVLEIQSPSSITIDKKFEQLDSKLRKVILNEDVKNINLTRYRKIQSLEIRNMRDITKSMIDYKGKELVIYSMYSYNLKDLIGRYDAQNVILHVQEIIASIKADQEEI